MIAYWCMLCNGTYLKYYYDIVQHAKEKENKARSCNHMSVVVVTVSCGDTYLDRLDDDDGLEEGEQEGGEPLDRLLAAPLHAVEDREERGRDDAEEHH